MGWVTTTTMAVTAGAMIVSWLWIRRLAPPIKAVSQGGLFLLSPLAAGYLPGEIILPVRIAFVLMLVL
jgi:hypothetical protein